MVPPLTPHSQPARSSLAVPQSISRMVHFSPCACCLLQTLCHCLTPGFLLFLSSVLQTPSPLLCSNLFSTDITPKLHSFSDQNSPVPRPHRIHKGKVLKVPQKILYLPSLPMPHFCPHALAPCFLATGEGTFALSTHGHLSPTSGPLCESYF